MCVPVKGGRGMFDNYKRVTFWSKWCLVNADGLHWHWPKYFYFGQHKFRSILGLHSTVVGSKTNVPPNLIKTVTTEAAIKKSEKLTSSTNSRLKNLSTKCISDLHFCNLKTVQKILSSIRIVTKDYFSFSTSFWEVSTKNTFGDK